MPPGARKENRRGRVLALARCGPHQFPVDFPCPCPPLSPRGRVSERRAKALFRNSPLLGENTDGVPGRNVPLSGRDVPVQDEDPPVGSYPSNPMGFYDMAAGLYEWVAHPGGPDEPDVRIFKGGSNISTLFWQTIPGRGTANPTPVGKILADRIFSDTPIKRRVAAGAPDVVYLGFATARCAASVSVRPDSSGFGSQPNMTGVDLSGPFGPYSPKGKYLGVLSR